MAQVMEERRFHSHPITKLREGRSALCNDQLALEEPLEIQIAHGPEWDRQWKTVAITMRTPGNDRELALGFLVGEGLIHSLDEIEAIYGRGPRYGAEGWQHSVRVALRPGFAIDLNRLQRNFYTTSSCGVCGKTSLEALELNACPPLTPPGRQVKASVVCGLPEHLREAQSVFERTGGLHAAGLFTFTGQALVVREDVGRHNAVDKVIGSQFLGGRKPPFDDLLVVSGRASFELMQKALASGIPILVAVGAPSSLAVEVAEKFGATLVGFTKARGFNIYTGTGRIEMDLGESGSDSSVRIDRMKESVV
jgi:FdhD protein